MWRSTVENLVGGARRPLYRGGNRSYEIPHVGKPVEVIDSAHDFRATGIVHQISYQTAAVGP